MVRTLDLFLLTLVRDGIRTPYEWQARADVSLGASLPAVKRLLEGRLVSEAEKGSRGRREFHITRTGRRALSNIDFFMEQTLDERPGDLESVLRLACMAISEGKIELARKLLLQAAEEQAKRSRRAERQVSVAPKGPSAAELYIAALAHCDASRLDATSKSLTSLISAFKLDSDRASPVRRRRKSHH
jgi:DNA-binding PadR family transcriptional regulator